MKYLKTFESSVKTPQIGDYILIYVDYDDECGFREEDVKYINNNLFKVIDYRRILHSGGYTQYRIEFPDTFDDDDEIIWIFDYEIKWFGSELIDIDLIKNSIKFNL
jgi:hypothetical protein